jgi:hypothetical protein
MQVHSWHEVGLHRVTSSCVTADISIHLFFIQLSPPFQEPEPEQARPPRPRAQRGVCGREPLVPGLLPRGQVGR